jgi:hypothetical protein
MLTKKQPVGQEKIKTELNKTTDSKEVQQKKNMTETNSLNSNKLRGQKNKTRVTVKYDVGFNNTLFLRGNGANLSWDKGIPLKNIKEDEWIWETEIPFTNCEFKVLINDQNYEIGENHSLQSGSTVIYKPQF